MVETRQGRGEAGAGKRTVFVLWWVAEGENVAKTTRPSENDVCLPPCIVVFPFSLSVNYVGFVVTKQQPIGTCSTNIHFRVSRNIF